MSETQSATYTHTPNLISHLDIIVPRRRWRRCALALLSRRSLSLSSGRSSVRRLWRLLGYHRLQVHIDLVALEDPEGPLGGHVRLVLPCGADDADGGVVDGELFVLLERFAEGVEAVADEVRVAVVISIVVLEIVIIFEKAKFAP